MIINREKLIKALEYCTADECNPDCPYYEVDVGCRTKIEIDALTLLKEQEPKQVIRKQGKREYSDGSIDYFGEWYCPHCGELLNRGFATTWIDYCYKCGKAVKWNA